MSLYDRHEQAMYDALREDEEERRERNRRKQVTSPKKLSEIGSTLYWGNWTDSRLFITEACAERERLKTEAPEFGHTTITHSYSPAERRELVEQAIHRWEGLQWRTNLATNRPATMEEFYESEGI